MFPPDVRPYGPDHRFREGLRPGNVRGGRAPSVPTMLAGEDRHVVERASINEDTLISLSLLSLK